MSLANKRVVVVSHIYALGPPIVDLEEYLRSRVRKLTIIGLPFSYSRIEKSFLRQYEGKQKRFELEKKPFIRRDWYLYGRDFVLALWWGFRAGKTDVFIGIDNVNAFVGLILRFFHRTEVVVYYTIDYNPERFSNNLMNSIYHWIDTQCVKRANWVWNLASVMVDEREKKGISPQYQAKQLTVPIGVNLNIKPKPAVKRHPYEIAYMGHLRAGQGVEFLIDAFPSVVKQIPQAKLAILGGGELLLSLRHKVKQMKLEESVYFSGFVKDSRDLDERLSLAQVAVAPYEDTPGNYTRYTDPGKPKSYLALGIPIVITKVPQFAKVIDKRKAGVAIDFDQKQLVSAIVELLKDQKKWQQYHNNALALANEYKWDDLFDKAFRSMKMF